MKRVIKYLRFELDLYLGQFFEDGFWFGYMLGEHPEYYFNEIAYMNEKYERENERKRSNKQEQISCFDFAAQA